MIGTRAPVQERSRTWSDSNIHSQKVTRLASFRAIDLMCQHAHYKYLLLTRRCENIPWEAYRKNSTDFLCRFVSCSSKSIIVCKYTTRWEGELGQEISWPVYYKCREHDEMYMPMIESEAELFQQQSHRCRGPRKSLNRTRLMNMP